MESQTNVEGFPTKKPTFPGNRRFVSAFTNYNCHPNFGNRNFPVIVASFHVYYCRPNFSPNQPPLSVVIREGEGEGEGDNRQEKTEANQNDRGRES